MLLLLLRPLLILLLGSSLILLQLVWLLLMSTVQALNCLVMQLTTRKACASTPHEMAYVPPLTDGAHSMVRTTLLLTPLILLGLLLSGRLLHQLSLNCMNNYDIISLTPLRGCPLILASTPVPLPGLQLSRLPQRSPLVVDMVSSLPLKGSSYYLLKYSTMEHRHG